MTLRELIDFVLFEEDTGNSFAKSVIKNMKSTILSSSGKKINGVYDQFFMDFIRERAARFINTKDINGNPITDKIFVSKEDFANEAMNCEDVKQELKPFIKRLAEDYYDLRFSKP